MKLKPMFGKRKKRKKAVDRQLLTSIYTLEAEWKQVEQTIGNSYYVDTVRENEQLLKLKQAQYMFLLREAKHRKLNALKY